ncbi:MAG TPA: hypothetical protein VGD01_19160 [Candidatus Elarobacter sp.]|jgi:hypothetical protein
MQAESAKITSKEEFIATMKTLVAELKSLLATADWGLARAWIRFSFLVDEDQVLLQGHSILERILPTVLNAHFVTPCNFRDHFREYASQLRLALHTGLLDSSEFAALMYLSRLRGDVIHGQRERIKFEDELILRARFRSATSFKPHFSDMPEADHFPGSLKRFFYVVGSILIAKRDHAKPFVATAWSAEYNEGITRSLGLIESFSRYGLYVTIARAVTGRARELENALIDGLDKLASGETLHLDQWVEFAEKSTWEDGRLVNETVEE